MILFLREIVPGDVMVTTYEITMPAGVTPPAGARFELFAEDNGTEHTLVSMVLHAGKTIFAYKDPIPYSQVGIRIFEAPVGMTIHAHPGNYIMLMEREQ